MDLEALGGQVGRRLIACGSVPGSMSVVFDCGSIAVPRVTGPTLAADVVGAVDRLVGGVVRLLRRRLSRVATSARGVPAIRRSPFASDQRHVAVARRRRCCDRPHDRADRCGRRHRTVRDDDARRRRPDAHARHISRDVTGGESGRDQRRTRGAVRRRVRSPQASRTVVSGWNDCRPRGRRPPSRA